MITGVVTSSREDVIPRTLYRPGGGEHALEAVIDTGFNGAFALPRALIVDLGLAWRGREYAVPADGSERLFEFHEAIVAWDGDARRTTVIAADSDPLVGMALLSGYELTIQAVPGGIVTITALP
jgi:clan AA aspartic protease